MEMLNGKMVDFDYKSTIEADRQAYNGYYYPNELCRLCDPFNIDKEIWYFQKLLRKCEHHFISKSIWSKCYKYYLAYKFKEQSLKLGFTIPPYVFGKGLHIAHRGLIVIHSNVRIGDNCYINAGVNIGTKAGYENKVPKIGNNVYIGPGAKIFGDIVIADGCAIGANAVVTKSFLEPDSIIAGVPAKVIGKVKRELHV